MGIQLCRHGLKVYVVYNFTRTHHINKYLKSDDNEKFSRKIKIIIMVLVFGIYLIEARA